MQIASVNVRRRSAVLHGLLQSSPLDIIMVQEPWYSKINTTRDDHNPEGVDVLGATANNMWTCYLPDHSNTDICKVAIYVRNDVASSAFIRCRYDLSLSNCNTLVLDLTIGDELLRLINVYHHVLDKCRDSLLYGQQ